jgi:predicted nucleic acid-binding protein
MLTIVLDTNILVGSFLTPRGESWEVVRRAKGQKLCLSPFILTEVWRTLRVSRLKKSIVIPMPNLCSMCNTCARSATFEYRKNPFVHVRILTMITSSRVLWTCMQII